MRIGERIPLHDHVDRNSGGRIASSTVVDAIGGIGAGGSAGGSGGGGVTVPGTYEFNIEGGQSVIKAHGSLGATATFDPTDGNVHTGTLTANCTFTLNAPSGTGAARLLYEMLQDGTGGWTITWPGSVVWVNGITPSPDTTAGSITFYALVSTDGGITWFATAGSGGTVTSVALTVPAELSVSGSPVTTSGTLAVTKATQTANTVWAGPTSGSAAQPTFRALVAADIPSGVGAVAFTIIGQETRTSDGSTVAWLLDNDFEADSVQAFNLTSGKALVVTETLPNTATIGAAGTAGDVLSFAYAASAI
jgi:hypothetical protein